MKDWADGILLAGTVFLIALLGLTVVHAAAGWLRAVRKPFAAHRDAVINVDQWTQERRARLAQLNHPAAKGIDARRAQLTAAAKFPERAK